MHPDCPPEPVDVLDLGERHALSIASEHGTLSAMPLVATGDGHWRRAIAGSGAADALVRLLVETPGRSQRGRFSVMSWTNRYAPGAERAITVDQTNESVIVGEQAVVKWATHLEPGPHPAPGRLSTLIAAGFTAMPTPWGVVTWKPESGPETLVVMVTGYLPGAVDGWTWAVEMFIAAAGSGDFSAASAACRTLGDVVADMHIGLAVTATRSTRADARRWRDNAFATLARARTLASPAAAALLTCHDATLAAVLERLADLTDVPILDAHGDLHVGQVLRVGDRLVVTDFDGNPVVNPAERVLPVPAAVDLAGILQSLSHVAVVAAKHAELAPNTLGALDKAARAALLEAYLGRLRQAGQADLHIEAAVPALRLQQVLREIVYAAHHLPRWMYVPDAALPALIPELIDESSR
ncbi:glucosamine kinase [Mycobacterium sp. SMC-4]|uniref:glucosamine kinase n=1 Tax=Mycobacterium sp. SMC-4 TaxID=2857059 RepID=UPI0021B3D31A|nr:glucosamine kinase [Mycobacterium sp. SMC-4]UXA15977.1 aminoglycoside phosphotransferase [Mycobacterium sp. SMC-4]